jgi:hypothetical protein
MLYVLFHDGRNGISWFNAVVDIDTESRILRGQAVGY